MTKNLETINNLNELSIKRLILLENYVKLMESLEANLGEYRFHLSKTKQAIGFSMVSASVIDEREMEPNFRVSVNKDSFSIFNDENGDPSNEDSKEKESKNLRKRQKSKDEEETKDKDEKGEEKKEKPPKHPFRPFGLLEPQSAKLARQQIQKCSLPLVLELASLRMQISNIEDSMKVEYKTSS